MNLVGSQDFVYNVGISDCRPPVADEQTQELTTYAYGTDDGRGRGPGELAMKGYMGTE